MARLPNISKYCVVRADGALAFFLSKVYAMLTPSIGLCAMPLTIAGATIPVASRMVGTTSIKWWNWRADAAGVVDVTGPGDGHALPGAAEV